MFCCFDWGMPQDQYNNNGVSSFPGQRRYAKTGGNALAAAAPSYNSCGGSESEMVSVQVPNGMHAGDTIRVTSPTSGKIVTANIPNGLYPGDTFMVALPSNDLPQFTQNRQATNLETSVSSSSLPVASQLQNQQHNKYQAVSAVPIPENRDDDAYYPQRRSFQDNTSNERNWNSFSTEDGIVPTSPESTSEQKLLLVRVPPGARPGSLIQVQVPGENRMISAAIPPNVSEFYVAYDPIPSYAIAPPPNFHPISTTTHAYNSPQQYGYANNTTTNNISYPQHDVNPYRGNNHHHYRNNVNNGSNMGMLAPMLAGAALLGGAGYMISHHNQGDTDDGYDDSDKQCI